jgi:hypothetical protein
MTTKKPRAKKARKKLWSGWVIFARGFEPEVTTDAWTARLCAACGSSVIRVREVGR